MTHFLNITLLICCCFTGISVSAQVQSHTLRFENESIYDFAYRERNNPVKVSEMKWNNHTVIVAYYETINRISYNDDALKDVTNIDINLYVQISPVSYIKVGVPSLSYSDGNPVIDSVFLANADTDTADELLILAHWKQLSDDVSGTMYATLAIDNLPADYTKLPEQITNLPISNDFFGCECSYTDGHTTEAKFTTSADVRAELKKRGFKQ